MSYQPMFDRDQATAKMIEAIKLRAQGSEGVPVGACSHRCHGTVTGSMTLDEFGVVRAEFTCSVCGPRSVQPIEIAP